MRSLLIRLGVSVVALAGPTAATAQTISFPAYPAVASTLGAIPDGPGPGCGTPGVPRNITFVTPEPAGLATVAIQLQIAHTQVGHLSATLIAPDGTQHLLFGRPGAAAAADCGSSGDLSGSYTFSDPGTSFWPAAATAGVVPAAAYRTSTTGGVAGGGVDTVIATTFAGHLAGGTWTLRLVDWGAGDTGTVTAASLFVTYPIANTGTNDVYTVPANGSLSVPAPGVLANDFGTGPLSVASILFRPATNGVFAIAANGSFTYTPNPGFVGTDVIAYYAIGPSGISRETAITIDVLPASPPTDLEVVDVQGSRVLLRWGAPLTGAAPTGYQLTWGLQPGVPLGQVVLPPSPTVLPITVPPGVYYVRLRTLSAVGGSAATTPEVAIPVGVASVPSVPSAPTAVVNGAALTLVWKNSFLAGTPTASELLVSGAATGVVPATGADWFQASSVPPGTYDIAVRTRNATGASAVSAPLSVTVPGTCVAPQVPLRAVAFSAAAGRLGAVWDPNPAGGAPERYEVVVSNAVSSTVGVGLQRLHDVPAAPGTYGLRVRAVNACGVSPLTALQTVVVP